MGVLLFWFCLVSIASILVAGILLFKYIRLKKEFSESIYHMQQSKIALLTEHLDKEQRLNEDLAQREEELTSNEEKLRQSLNVQTLLLQRINLKHASLMAMINNTSDLIFSLDKDFCIVDFNDPARIFYSKREASFKRGVHMSRFVATKNIMPAAMILEAVMLGEPKAAIFDRVEENGEKTFYESSYNPIWDENNKVIGISVMIREITGRIKAEQLRIASEEKFSKAFLFSPDSVIITALSNSRIVEMNEGFLSWSGYTREEATGKTTLDLGFWDPAEREFMKQQLLEHGKIRELEVHLRIKSGEVRDCLLSAETIEVQGELCLISITRDITNKKKHQELLIELLNTEKQLNNELAQREEELTSSEEELRQSLESQSILLEEIKIKEANVSALMNNTQDLIYSADLDFRIIEFNHTIYNFFSERGIKLYKGMLVTDFIFAKNREGVLATIQRALEGEPAVFMFDLIHKNKKHFYEGYYTPIIKDDIKKEILGVSVVIRDITERKKAEEAHRISEERYSIWFRSSPDAMTISTIEEGIIIDANDSFLKNRGATKEEVIGKTSVEIGFMQDSSDREKIRELMERDGYVTNFELKTKRKSGENRTVLISAAPLEVDGKRCMITTARDITQLKKVEEELRIINDRLKVILDNVPVAIWALDKDGTITLSEGKALAGMGLKPGEHVGLSVYDVYNNREEQLDYIKPVLEDGITFRRSDKIGKGYYDEIISPIRDNNEGIIGLIGVSFDVTEVREKKEQLRENEALLNNIIDHLPIGLQIFDEKGFSIKMNDTQQSLLGLKSKELGVGKFNAMTDPVNTVLGFNKLFERAFRGEIVDNVELMVDFEKLNNPVYDRQEVVWFNLWLYPLFNDKKEVIAIINLLDDITERKCSEKAIEQKNDELMQLNIMMADYKLMALRSAMNPHFIFNAMNSIQYFISKNERENALIYLSLFSKLIRNILTGTVENKITIHHEMETLQNYIELENLRFDKKFEVVYEIDDTLDTRQIEIPSLLLQPYVENAILHGLYNKKENGILKIKILSHNENTVIFVVEDNGVGREEAKKIKQANQINNYKSVGMVLTKERLDIINKTNNVSVDIKDLLDKNGNPMGTRIEIYVEVV